MPVFNGERYLRQAIDSILVQTFGNFEFVIVNDGSADSTGPILDALAARDGRIVPVHLEQNRGLTAALNEGVRRSRGALIARMDADDEALPSRFDKQLAFLEANPQIAVLGTAVQVIDEAGRELEKKLYPGAPHLVAWSLSFFSSLAHPTTVFRRNCISVEECYPPRYASAEDYAFFLAVSNRFRLANLDEPLLRYRRWGGNVSRDRIQLLEGARILGDWLRANDIPASESVTTSLLGLSRGQYPGDVGSLRELVVVIEALRKLHTSRAHGDSESREITKEAAVRLWQVAAVLAPRDPAGAFGIAVRATSMSPASLASVLRRAFHSAGRSLERRTRW